MGVKSAILLGLAVCLPGCAMYPEGTPTPQDDIDLSFEPVGRIVNTYRNGFRYSIIETDTGHEHVFTDAFRSPDSPAGTVPVDCVKTEQIGVWLTPLIDGDSSGRRKTSVYSSMHRRISTYSKIPRIDVQWTHSARPDGDRRYGHGQFVSLGSRFIVKHNLSKKDKVDGVMTLEVSHGDEVLYATSFELMGCKTKDAG